MCLGAMKHSYLLQWHHNGRDGISNHQPHDCLLNRLFRRRSKKTSKLLFGKIKYHMKDSHPPTRPPQPTPVYVRVYTPGQKFIEFFFQRAVTSRWRGKSTNCQCRNGNTSYFYKFVKFHRCRRNGHGPVPLKNEQRFKFAMSTYTRSAHHCDQRWTCVLTAFRDSHSESNSQQFRLRKLSPRLNRFHEMVRFYVFMHYIEKTISDHQQFHSISHHE